MREGQNRAARAGRRRSGGKRKSWWSLRVEIAVRPSDAPPDAGVPPTCVWPGSDTADFHVGLFRLSAKQALEGVHRAFDSALAQQVHVGEDFLCDALRQRVADNLRQLA